MATEATAPVLADGQPPTAEHLDEVRAVVTCVPCRLRQFKPAGRLCRRCHQPWDGTPLVPPALVAERPTIRWRPLRPRRRSVIGGIALAIRLLRLAHGMSQRELAEKLGVPRPYISKIEIGKTWRDNPKRGGVSRAALFNFAAALEITPRLLILAGQALSSEEQSMVDGLPSTVDHRPSTDSEPKEQ